jgi:hypothetical protein
MDTNGLTTVLALLVALSVAAERLAEIIKGVFPCLNQENADPKKERWRKIALQLLAGGCGVLTAYLAGPAIRGVVPEAWTTGWGLLALGLLASGGSGFWNAVLGYVKNVKDIKKLEKLDILRRQAGP